MLKIVYRICCGMDVHKSFVVACIRFYQRAGSNNLQKQAVFSTFTGDLRRCADWLSENNCKDVCMESTGKYWIPIYNILEPNLQYCPCSPKYVKAIRGKKTDKRDAKWIADIFKHDPCSWECLSLRQISANFETCSVIVGNLPASPPVRKTGVQNCLTVSNFKLDDVFSDVFGKGSLRDHFPYSGKSNGENYGCFRFPNQRHESDQ